MPNHRDQRMQMLMQLLPVIMAQQERQQQNALGYAQLDRQTQHDNAQDVLARLGLTQQGDWHQGELQHQKAMEALGLRQADSADVQQRALMAHQDALLAEQSKYHQGELDMHKAGQEQALNALLAGQTNEAAKLGLTAAMEQQRQERQLQQQMLDSYTRFAGATPEGLASLGKNFNIPGAEAWMNEGQNDVASKQAASLQAAFGPVYAGWNKDPHAAQAGLNTLWQDPRMQSPAIQDHMREWLRGQNEGLYKAPPTGQPQVTNASNQVGRTTGNVLNQWGYGIMDAPASVWNHTGVPLINALSGLFGGGAIMPDAKGLSYLYPDTAPAIQDYRKRNQ